MNYDPHLVDEAIKQIRREIHTTCTTWSEDIQARMRSDAPWNDRNGPSLTGLNARQSLVTEVGIQETGDIQIVARTDRMTPRAWGSFEGAPVGVFLELGTRNMSRRDIIWPTLENQAPALRRQLNYLLKG